MKQAAFLTSLLLMLVLKVQGAEHGGAEATGEIEIPFAEIGWQAANLGILLVLIFIFTKKSIVEAFAARRDNYLSQAEKTKVALREAETALTEIKTKLSTLENGEQKSLEAAKIEAKLMAENLLKDAEAATIKMKKDAEQVISAELIKAKNEINTTILNHAVAAATQKLSGAGVSGVQEAGFINQLEQVK